VKYHVEDKRPITPAESRRGMEALREWPEEDRSEIFRLPENEASIVLLLAGELGAVPYISDTPVTVTIHRDMLEDGTVPDGAGPGNVYPGSGEPVPGSNPAP
jgi:hypothetical protein